MDIGEQSVVAANSFVNKSVPPGSVVAGSPARLIGRVVGSGASVSVEFDNA